MRILYWNGKRTNKLTEEELKDIKNEYNIEEIDTTDQLEEDLKIINKKEKDELGEAN